MHGYNSSDEVVGKHFTITLVEEDLNKAQQFMENLLTGEITQVTKFTSVVRMDQLDTKDFLQIR